MKGTIIDMKIRSGEELAKRWQRFYDTPGKGFALIQMKSIGGIELPKMKPLNQWSFPDEMEPYLDARMEREKVYWQSRAHIEDDMFCTVSPWYGIAEHTAFLGGKVDFSPDTSYNHPMLEDWSDFDKLKLDPQNPWLRMVVDGIAYLRKQWGDLFYTRLRGADGPSDIANIVRGNDLFMDFYDYPEEIHKLMDFCADAAKFTLELQKEQVDRIGNGFVSGFDIWLPGNSIGQISEDASCMVSPEIYEEFFLPALKKLCKGYDYVMIHTHSLGKRILPYFVKVPEIKVLEISSDPNSDRAVKVFREYEEVLKDVITIVQPTRAELEDNMDLFERNKTIIWYSAENLKDAEEVTAIVRKYLNKF